MITKDSLNPLVLALVGTPELAEKWWTTFNRYFNNTPINALEIDPDNVKEYLLRYCYAP